MRLVIIQSAGEHPENRDFREALCLQRAAARLGEDCVVWGRGYQGLSLWPWEDAYAEYKPDAILILENYDTGWVPDLSDSSAITCPVLFWTIDSHCQLKEHMAYAHKHNVDAVLSSTEKYLEHYKWTHSFWFPNCVDDEYIKPMPGVPKEHYVGFCGSCGSHGPRRTWLDYLGQNSGLHEDLGVLGDAMVRAIHSYHIHFNVSLADDLNFRVFETLGCGTCLLTNEVPDLKRLFKDTELLTYRTPSEALDILMEYKDRPLDLAEIAARGHRAVLRDHTYVHRYQSLIEIVKEIS